MEEYFIWRILVSSVILSLGIFQNGEGYMVRNNPFNRLETLDPQGKYELEWEVDWKEKRVTFTVTVETRGFVAFGLGKNVEATGGDFVVGGMDSKTGQSYFSDRHLKGNKLILDEKQDWRLHSARENKTHTELCFSRAFDTCDSQDYPITMNTLSLIWAYGRSDRVDDIFENYGTFNVYLLDPDYTPKIVRNPPGFGPPTLIDSRFGKDVQVWSVSERIPLPDEKTSYICTMHKIPRLQKKHHAIGIDVVFDSEQTRKHIHHMFIYKCTAPRSSSARALFEPFVGQSKEACYAPQAPSEGMPTHLCSEMYLGHAIGGKPYFTPDNVGFPFGESQDEYYIFQIHYDNAIQDRNVILDLRVELFYTSKLRQNDASMMLIGHHIPGLAPSLLVPPETSRQIILGHCSGDCTRRMFPPEGITVFANSLHTHNAGRELHLRHFRGDQELPWIVADDNFQFNFQQTKARQKELKILPGDHVTMSCAYDSTGSNGTVVGGYGTSEEMCVGFILYYSRLPEYTLCWSGIESDEYRKRILGIGNVTWSDSHQDFLVDPPHPLASLTVKQVSDNFVNWDGQRRRLLERFQLSHPQTGTCPRRIDAVRMHSEEDFSGETRLPITKKMYQSEGSC